MLDSGKGPLHPTPSECQQQTTEPVQTGRAPVDPMGSIGAIDVLRGLALFGVLTVNLITGFRVSIFQQFLVPQGPDSALDDVVKMLVNVGLESKAFALFSFLFGVGLAIQFERLARNPSRLRWLIRRLLVLLGVGLIHLCLIWNGDILTEYALLGLVALPFLYLPNKALAVVSLVALGIFVVFPLVLPGNIWPSDAWIRQHVATATNVYSSGSYAQIIQFSLGEIPDLLPLHGYVAPRTVALFLLGALAWRTGLLAYPQRHRHTLLGVAMVGLVFGLPLSLLQSPNPISPWFSWAPLISILMLLGPIVLSLGYGATVIAAVTFSRLGSLLRLFGPLGRMALTNYLMQSVIFGWIFFGYGLGYFDRMSAAHAMVLGLGVYAAQIIFSRWWLKRFRFGPMEWLWRTLMYGVRQPWT